MDPTNESIKKDLDVLKKGTWLLLSLIKIKSHSILIMNILNF
jgi:hypothetical protein